MGNNGELRNLLGNNSLLCDPKSRRYCYLHLLKVRDIFGLLTSLGADYVTRPFFPAPQRKTGKSDLATRD